ncbi:MAG: pyruvate kinase [Defluviitaleaceae bacterium]|nr:pyruvate kinase [Defluviitaleaceae bacterium]
MRKTKILATIGPACNNVETLIQMIEAGIDGARFNFSHETHEYHAGMMNQLKEARAATGKHIPIILDTQGPEIRTKTLKAGKVYLEQGQEFVLTTEDVEGDNSKVSVTYENLPRDLKIGSRVLIDDGLIEMTVTSKTDTEVNCTLVNSGFLGNRKGINVPDVFVELPSLTNKDIDDIVFGISQGIDYVAASFVRAATDILNIRKVLEKNGGAHVKLIAKIENRDGVNNLDSILEVADGIMVARGDLGVEIPPEEVPIVQKDMIRRCNQAGKIVATATHMLESMVNNPRPTRAEANDVANAIFDGSDVVMLSGETAGGKWPVDAVKMMARIASMAEASIDYAEKYEHLRKASKNITNTISSAAVATAAALEATCIVTITDSGFAAKMVSRARPSCPILAVTADPSVCRQLNLAWGCTPMLVETPFEGDSEVFDIAEEMALKSGITKSGDTIVALAGVPVGSVGATNTLRIRTIGDVLAKGEGSQNGIVKGIARVLDPNNADENVFFEQGDIAVCTHTSDKIMEQIKKAGALVIGSWEKQINFDHAKTVAKALDIPMLQVDVRAVDYVKTGTEITVDTNEGLLFIGYKD